MWHSFGWLLPTAKTGSCQGIRWVWKSCGNVREFPPQPASVRSWATAKDVSAVWHTLQVTLLLCWQKSLHGESLGNPLIQPEWLPLERRISRQTFSLVHQQGTSRWQLQGTIFDCPTGGLGCRVICRWGGQHRFDEEDAADGAWSSLKRGIGEIKGKKSKQDGPKKKCVAYSEAMKQK